MRSGVVLGALLACTGSASGSMPRLRLEDLSHVITTASDFDTAGFGKVRRATLIR
jgi:hypothetical protein